VFQVQEACPARQVCLEPPELPSTGLLEEEHRTGDIRERQARIPHRMQGTSTS